MHFVGNFYGHRRLPPPLPALMLGPIRIDWWRWSDVGPVAYDYKSVSGTCPDAYPATFTQFEFTSRLVLINIWDFAMLIEFTADGVTPIEEREIQYPGWRIESTVGFRTMNAVAGDIARYQIVYMR